MKTNILSLLLVFLCTFSVHAQTNHELHFDGHQAIAFSTPIQMTGDFTLEFWAYLEEGINEEDRIFTGSAQEIHFLERKLTLTVNGANLIENPVATVPGEWHHYAIRRNGEGLQLLVDGEMVESIASEWSGPLALSLMGKKAMEHCGFKGRLDEVRFWAIARGDEEIRVDYARNVTPATKDFFMLEAYFKFNEGNVAWVRDYMGHQPDVWLPDATVRKPSSSVGLFTDKGVPPLAFDRTINAMGKVAVPLEILTGVIDPDGILDAEDIVILEKPAFGELMTDGSDLVVIHLQFSSLPKDFSAYIAPLKYNKQVAHSLTLDDGLASAYEYVFPYLNGGTDKSGQTHHGKFYTDGCGNDIPFRADIGWNSVNRLYHDLHIDTPGQLSWGQLIELHEAGWCVMNHSYAHGDLVKEIGIGSSILKNQSYVHANSTALGTPIWMKHLVVPSGDLNFIDPAFQAGLLSAHSENGTGFVGGEYGWRVDSLPDLNGLTLNRTFKNIHFTSQTIHEDLDTLMNQSQTGKRYWYNDFTHGVEPGGSAGGLDFAILEGYMDHLEANYGKPGSDNLWMASSQEVYEYLYCRQHTPYNIEKKDRDVLITLDMNSLPQDFRWYDLTIAVDCSLDFEVVSVSGVESFAFKGSGPNKLVNFSLDHTQTGEVTHYRNSSRKQSTDFFTYAVRDKDGNLSPPATIGIVGLRQVGD